MKRIHRELIRIAAATMIVVMASFIYSCGKGGSPPSLPPVSDAFITAAVSAGTSAGLNLAIKDAAKRKVIAQYLNTYAGALRTITGNPTPDQLTQQLMAFIPPDVAAQYPELGSFAVPLVVSFYQWAESKYGAASTPTGSPSGTPGTPTLTKVQEILNDVANGIETGSSCCI